MTLSESPFINASINKPGLPTGIANSSGLTLWDAQVNAYYGSPIQRVGVCCAHMVDPRGMLCGSMFAQAGCVGLCTVNVCSCMQGRAGWVVHVSM